MKVCPRKIIYAMIYGAPYVFVPVRGNKETLLCFHRQDNRWKPLVEYGRADLNHLFATVGSWKKIDGPPTGIPRYDSKAVS